MQRAADRQRRRRGPEALQRHGAAQRDRAGDDAPCNDSSVTGIGRDAAGKNWYRALTFYLTSGTTYGGARTPTLSAARDLYGAGSVQQNTVAAAWSAVSVG